MKGYGHKRRLIVIAGLLGVAFAGLGARLVVLQVCDHERYRAAAERKQVFLREPRRGEILDANGNPLAISVPVKKIFANPKFIGSQYPEVARALAPLLGMNEAELARKLQPTILRTNEFRMPITNSYVNLKKKVTLEQWQQITQVMNGLTFAAEGGMLTKNQKRYYRALRQKGIYAEDDQQRTYPGGRLASHVLGFVQDEELEFNDTHLTEMTGKYGIERWFNNQLRGVRGWRISETDHKRREIVVYRQQEVEAMPGLNVVLSLDVVIQNILESALDDAVQKHSPKSASAMVVRPATGEILGMAVWPDFDPANPGTADPDHMRNRIVADTYEPGSVFKIVAISAALNENLVTLSDTINCENGLWHYAGRPLKDHGHYGVIPVEMVVGKSSNIGTAKIGLMLGEDRLYKYLIGYGFGSRTGITLDGEVPVPLRPPRQWDKLKITRIPIGQGIAVTHIQMMMAMSAVANKGRLMRPMLVTRLEDQTGHVFAQYHPQMVRQVVSEHAAHLTVTALKNVVSTNGTARAARLDHYTVAGKTGTAEKPLNGAYTDEYVASFFGFFPADNPQVCISIVLDEPEKDKGYFGGAIAAPIFKSVAEQTAKYLKIRPDRDDPSEGPISIAQSE
ncbi:MAG TPA: penicillin-binding protein 2 [Verrucomicrobiae bacterium]|nr:penicillin-binding protein 2 [Verrucomicrobiae bacterium]